MKIHLDVVDFQGKQAYPVAENVTVLPLAHLAQGSRVLDVPYGRPAQATENEG